MKTQHFDLKDIRAAACGNWQAIHAALGIPAHLLNKSKHQPCPACGGKDRFRYTDFQGNGGFICNQCTPQGGSGFDLLMLVFGLDFSESVKEVARLLGMTNEPTAATKHTPRMVAPTTATIELPTDKQAHFIECFQAAKPIEPNSVVAAYLAGRGLPPCALSPAAIREAEALLWVNDVHGKPFNVGRFPCMVAAITSPNGELQGLHYTYFEHNGDTWAKLNVLHPQTHEPLPTKKMFARFSGSLKGAAVHMEQADQQGRLLVAEGIETALAARALFQLPAVAALSANGMRSFEIPANVQELYIVADNDHSKTGFHAAHDLAVRAIKQGVIAHIWQPEIAGFDALDEYNRRQSFNQSQI